jgi:hypothetical protein
MDPVVEIVTQSDTDRSRVRHVDPAVANARRTILAEIENVAIVHENVLVTTNTCLAP